MSDYYNNNNHRRRKRKKSLKEKIGFYSAFSICLIAVCMAVYSTYNTLSTGKNSKLNNETQAVVVNNEVTGVTEEDTTYQPFTIPTINSIVSEEPSNNTEETTEPSESQKTTKSALQTMLSADVSLTYPLKSKNVLREYNEDSVYFKTLNTWKPHPCVDFAGNLGDDVCSMCSGTVKRVFEDKLYGNSVEIAVNNALCVYNGLDKISVKEGDAVEAGTKIGVIGTVPCEATDENHIQVAIKVDGKFCDPLSLIGNNE